MDITFKCPNCDQELEMDASGAGTEIECPACSKTITVPAPEGAGAPAAGGPVPKPPTAPIKVEKHFVVPVRESATIDETLIQKPSRRPLEIIAKEGDKTMRIKTFKRSDCVEVGKDHFDEVVSAFLEKVGHPNIVSVNTINYSFMELGTRNILMDYGVMIVFKG